MTDRDDPLAPMIAALKEPVSIAPDLAARVLAELGPAEDPRVVWWRRPLTIRLTPIGGLAIAAGLAAIVFVSEQMGRRAVAGSLPVAAAAAGPGMTQFVLIAKDAKAVAVVGDFNDWNLAATPLARADSNGVWWVTVPLLPGRYRYAYVVDGTVWRPDPEAPAAEDEFGRPNSVVTIGGA